LEDIKRYLSKFNDPIDPLSNEVLTFLERVKGIPQTPNLRRHQQFSINREIYVI
jgi:hypothetical protein